MKVNGFTLVEIMVSILILTVAFAGLALAFSSGLMAIKATRETSDAIQAAQQELEILRNTPFAGIQTHSFSVSPLDTNGTVVVESLGTDIKKVSVNIQWTSGSSKSMSKEFLTYITRDGINRQ